MTREPGTQPALDELMRRYRRLVYRIAYGFTRDADSAMDITQNTFLKVHERRSEWRGDGEIRNWIARIAANESMNFGRGEQRRAAEPLEFVDAPAVPPNQHASLVRRENERALHRSLEALPERQRLAVVLRYFEGLSSREIAAVLDCSEDTARNTLLRSLRKLRSVLSASGSREALS